jgi:Ca2+-binding EF-hand superfamily protein
MKRHLGLIGVLGALALTGCGRSNEADDGDTALDEQQSTLVAALAANEDGSDEAWTSAAGSEPFLVEGCGFGAIVARVIERFDADGSGDLSEEERAALVDEFGDPAERFELLVSLYDTDASGALEASELDVVKADLEARCESRREAVLERFDANGDGTLDADEREAAHDALRERFAERHAARVERFDRNGDGQLGPLERRRAGGVIRDRLADRREAIADEFDADQNGELDEAEREALAEHLRACVRGEAPLLPETPAEPAPDEEADSD